MDDTCRGCGLRYSDMRTGMTYADVFAQFWVCDDDRRKWHPKRRRTILGRWHEIKRDMWAEHIAACEESDE